MPTGSHGLALAGALAAALLLTACATGAPPRMADVALPASYDTLPHGTRQPSLDRWWTLYDDPQLTQLIQAALAQGFTVRSALARLEETRALRSVALARFDPQGNLQGSADYRDTRNLEDAPSSGATTAGATPAAGAGASLAGIGATKSASLSLPVSWELDLFGRRDAAGAAARADVVAARFDVEAARAAIAAEVARSLFQARGFKVQAGEALETVRIQREVQTVVAERARRGLTPSSELDRVATDVAQAEAQAERWMPRCWLRAARCWSCWAPARSRWPRSMSRRDSALCLRCQPRCRATCWCVGPTCGWRLQGCSAPQATYGSPNSACAADRDDHRGDGRRHGADRARVGRRV